MKHERVVTTTLIIIFALSQFIGLALVGRSLDEVSCQEVDGSIVCDTNWHQTVIGARPETEGWGSIAYILIGIGIGTAVLLLIAKFNQQKIWKAWFFLAVWITAAIALGTLLPSGYNWIAWLIALGLTAWKLTKPNMIVYNLTEVLMYAGMAVLLVPILYVKHQTNEIMSIWPVLLLLSIISIYDMIAVWKSGHMVTMAKFITNSNAFAGLVVPYTTDENKITMKLPTGEAAEKTLEKKSKHKNAILGGGDITFPLLFAGVLLQSRTVEAVRAGIPFADAVTSSFVSALIVGLGATIAIALLFLLAKKDKFYPAMPFITAGVLVGWGLSFIV